MPSIFTVLPWLPVLATAALVFAAGWRLCAAQNAPAGGTGALLVFILHPAVTSGLQAASPWDAFFVMLFVCAWLWMEHWSLFMRSWILAGVFSIGLWIGSPFVLWGLMAMVPWVLFNRRPLAGIVSLLTVFLGGLAWFAVTWGGVWLFLPTLGRPLISQWVRWRGLALPPEVSLPWLILASGAVLERLQAMVRERRSDASIFMAVLVLVTAFLASPYSGPSLIALSAPLIARMLVKKEFLFLRRVRWVAGSSFVLTLAMPFVVKQETWIVTGLSMLLVGIGLLVIHRNSRLPRFMAGEAVCAGGLLAESLTFLLRRYPL